MDEDAKNKVIEELNRRLGDNIDSLNSVYDLHKEYLEKKQELQNSLSLASSEIPLKVESVLKRHEEATKTIKQFQEKLAATEENNLELLKSVAPIKDHLSELVEKVRQLKATKEYLKTLETVQNISADLQNCTDSEQSILLLHELYEMRQKYNQGHRGNVINETAHYWYNILKEKLSTEFEEVLKLVKWPITSTNVSLTTSVSSDSFNRFKQIVQFLFQIQMPAAADEKHNDTQEGVEQYLSLPVRLMLVPLKKRFNFHFSGNRRTNRLDRPEWFLTQILSWLRDHLPFLAKNLQPIADKLDIKINVQVEFTCGLVELAVDRLHLLLSTIAGDDSLFSHAVDECLGFDRELEDIAGYILPPICPRVTSVLTDARYIVRWLAVEKKFAIQKIDEMMSGTEWLHPIKHGITDPTDDLENIPQGADWLISLLQTLHDRYSLLPQPGHRLQFLEMQIELCEEIRLRLTQLIGEELRHGSNNKSGHNLEGDSRLLALLNVAHFFRHALLDWTHSVSYLQLHYYKKQFHCFTEMQHLPIPDLDITPQREISEDSTKPSFGERRASILLSQVESDACQLALHEASAYDEQSPSFSENVTLNNLDDSEAESGVFEELPALFGRLVENACHMLCEDLVLEVKAVSRDYRNQKWHHIPEVANWQCRSLSPALCAPLGALSTRLLKLKTALAPELFTPLWKSVAREIDEFIFEEVVLECWWGTGGIQQFHFDMSRNLLPIFAQYTNAPEARLPKIAESCKLLTMLKGTAILLTETVVKNFSNGVINHNPYSEMGIVHLKEENILRVLNQRTDMTNLSFK